ncbi:hypothetical protein M885DRAFT_496939 [Pelagophyceae sp. CCMP2097]|nr:hypothetical protein M885DRAFT_496939 [Pelagophyceae sp. CCMP2097]
MILVILSAVFAGGIGLLLVGGAKDLPQALWRSWTYMADPGTHAGVTGTGPQLVSLGVTLTGVLLSSAILGFVVEAIQQKLDSLKHGVNHVVERDHTLILGWTHETCMVVEELCIANASEVRPSSHRQNVS